VFDEMKKKGISCWRKSWNFNKSKKEEMPSSKNTHSLA